MSTIKQAINAEKSKGVTIRFEIRTEKKNKDGKVPVRLVFQIKGNRKFYNTTQSIMPACWDIRQQQAIYINKKTCKALYPKLDYELLLTETECKEFNDNLNSIVQSIKKVTDRFIMDKTVFSAEMVIDSFKGNKTTTTKKTEPSNILFDFIEQYLEDNKVTREAGSLSVYKSMRKHLQAYQVQHNKVVTFDKINYSFFQSYQNFLIGRTKVIAGITMPMLNNITIAKQLSSVKTFLNYAKLHNITISDDYKKFKISKENLEVIALTNEEFENLYSFDLSNNKRLSQVRDMFCFACSTGFRYSDMKQLKKEHIKEDEIILTVIKTNERLTVPLNTYSKEILAKYITNHKPLPMISNQKMNVYLKELGELTGINEPIEIVRYYGVKREAIIYPKYELIGCHTGRKTFVCLSLEKGMSAEQVMACTGHKDYKSFKRYLNVTEKLKKVVMLKAWGGQLNESKLKVV